MIRVTFNPITRSAFTIGDDSGVFSLSVSGITGKSFLIDAISATGDAGTAELDIYQSTGLLFSSVHGDFSTSWEQLKIPIDQGKGFTIQLNDATATASTNLFAFYSVR